MEILELIYYFIHFLIGAIKICFALLICVILAEAIQSLFKKKK